MAAVLVALGGLWHLQVWDKTYRHLPAQVPGVWVVQKGFPVNAAASIVVAALLLLTASGLLPRLRGPAALAALGLEVGSAIVLVLSRGPGIFHWREKGDWGSDPKRILVVEIAAVVVLAVTLALQPLRRSPDDA